jgi:hypothetical protein
VATHVGKFDIAGGPPGDEMEDILEQVDIFDGVPAGRLPTATFPSLLVLGETCGSVIGTKKGGGAKGGG